MTHPKKTLVVGASNNPERYSFKAIQALLNHGHPVEAIGKRETTIGKIEILTGQPHLEEIDTITLYLSADNQAPLHKYFISLHPKRIIFNPGAENPSLEQLATSQGITCQNACTLVLLATGQY